MLVVFENNGLFRVVGTASEEIGLASAQEELPGQETLQEFVANNQTEKPAPSGTVG